MTFQVEVQWNVAALGPIFSAGVKQLAAAIRKESRADVKAGIRGRFDRGVIVKTKRIDAHTYVITEHLKPAFAKVWEYGGHSVGRPLLWMPSPPHKLKLRHYAGKLLKKGRTLISQGSGVRVRGMHGTGTRKAEVQFIGVHSVTHRQRFHLRNIATREAQKFINYMGSFRT